jgi:hypothetical protein
MAMRIVSHGASAPVLVLWLVLTAHASGAEPAARQAVGERQGAPAAAPVSAALAANTWTRVGDAEIGPRSNYGMVWAPSLKRFVLWGGADRIWGCPKADMVMIGFLLDGESGLVVPFYDCEKNRWLAAKMPGAEFMNGGKKAKPGSSVDLGLAYDPKRDLVWSTLCSLRGEGSLQVVRVDAATLGATPLK